MLRRGRNLPSLRYRMIWSNLATAMILLLVCTVILFSLIYNVLQGYVQKDLNFVLQETLANMDDKTLLVEDAYQRVCADKELESLLSAADGINDSRGQIQMILNAHAGLHLKRNLMGTGEPFLDMIYLFDRNGSYVSASYRKYNANIQETWDKEYNKLNHRFQRMAANQKILRARNHINVMRKLYDGNHQYLGTVILGIDENAFIEMSRSFTNYPGAFWMIHEERNNRLLASQGNPMENADIQAISMKTRDGTCTYRYGHTNYMVCASDFRMGLGGIVAVPENYFKSLLFGSVRVYLFAMFGVIVLLGATLMLRSNRAFSPLQDMVEKIGMVTDGQLNTRLPAYPYWEYDTIASSCNAMLDHIDHLINDVYEKKLLIMDSEMRYLQAQIDPHFMYNVLNTIALNAKIDGNEEVYRMTSNFMGLTQARLTRDGKNFVSLEQELKYVQFYLEIQQSRFGDKIGTAVQIPKGLYQAKVPKLALEMLVENAVKHGIEPKYGPGQVVVTAYLENQDLVLQVEDDGVGFAEANGAVLLPLPNRDPKPGHNQIAINTTHLLIRHYYGEPYGLQIWSHSGEGTRVQMRVPFEIWKDGAENV